MVYRRNATLMFETTEMTETTMRKQNKPWEAAGQATGQAKQPDRQLQGYCMQIRRYAEMREFLCGWGDR